MPIIDTVQGDLLAMFGAGEFTGIAHGCNCFMTMGAGIAKQIATKYPEALEADHMFGYKGERSKLGRFSFVLVGVEGFIHNLYTQYRPGKEKQSVLHNAIHSAFTNLNNWYGKDHPGIVGIPLIGCGLAGGNWKDVSKIIDDVTPTLKLVVVKYNPST